jgi:addiction module HigA family antidote
MDRIPTDAPPAHPGEALREDFLPELGLSQSEVARRLNISFRRVNEILNEKRSVTPDTALRLGKLFGQSPEFWMNLQLTHDLYHARRSKTARDLDKIMTLVA